MIPSYQEFFREIGRGAKSMPRGLSVVEIHNTTVLFRPGEMPGRQKINWSLGIMEGLQLLAGVFDIAAIQRVAPKADLTLFTDQSAYGPRVAGQFPAVVAALQQDPYTRRAVLVLPRHQEAGTAAMPCTTSIQFHIFGRPARLVTSVVMRSSDAVYGLPYDVVQFGMLAQAVAGLLGVETGGGTIFIGNAHIYESTRHLEPTTGGGSFLLPKRLAPSIDYLRGWALEQVDKAPWVNHQPEGMVVDVA